MEKRHIINLSGREFVTYEGLLDDAHARGLKSIRTFLVQVPTEANGNVAICTAEVELANPDGEVRLFTGIGDANPRNVNRNIANHLIRMSETRAKARALRDAVNVGMTAYEELEGAELAAEQGAPAQRTTTATRRSPAPKAKATPPQPGPELASRSQIDTVSKEMKRTAFSQQQGREYLLQHFAKTSRLELTHDEIEAFTDHLRSLPSAEPQEATV